MLKGKLFLLLYAAVLSTATISLHSQPLFQLLSPKETNIKFSNDLNETENLNVLAYEYFYNGGGVAVGDINNDGLPDVFFTGNMKPNKLYLNLGNMKFKDITAEASRGLEGRSGGWKTGATMADVNGDGLLDIYVCYSGKVDGEMRRNQLFINQGNLKFLEKAKEYGLDDESYSTQAAFFDYDNDGDLDMFLLNHSIQKIDNLEFAKYRGETDGLSGDKLFENTGNHFTDISQKAGIRQNILTFGLGIAIADINKDGWQDIYVTNDYNEPDYLYINNGNGTFTDKSEQSLRHLSQFSMGVDIADFNNDALPDIITLDMLPEDNRRQKLLQLQENYESFELMQQQGLHKQYMRNMLHLNNGDNTFSEIGQQAGVSNTDWSWCPLFADFDNDGYKDLFISNGYLRDYTNKDFLKYRGDYKVKKAIDREPALLMDLITAMPVTTLPNYIFKNNRELGFVNKQQEWGLGKAGISSGAVYADLDNDGDLDLIVSNINEPPSIYKNMSREQNNSNYLAINLRYKNPNINAIGAKLYVYNGAGVQYQEVNPSRGYLSCTSTTLHFGMGTNQQADSVKIIWPDNSAQLYTGVSINRKWVVQYDKTATRGTSRVETKVHTVFTKIPAPVNYINVAPPENDFKRQPLMLFMYSKAGPAMAKADINNDGLEDVFISGDKNKPGKIYLQLPGGKFKEMENVSIGNENESTVAAAAFFDANGDGLKDLYIAKGGYGLWVPGTSSLQDELYLNNGAGGFIAHPLPDVNASAKSCVRPCDYDNDGDIDVFIGGHIIPGSYPATPQSYLLNNDGKGNFTILPIPFSTIGMVTDAQWTDINKDGRKDLVLCGEFMPITIFINTASGFVNKTNDYFERQSKGFWSALTITDIDGDGNDDIIAGNIGSNTQFHISATQPGEMYFADFDDNGSIDPFFNCFVQGVSYPFVSRDEINEQIYPMRRKFRSYKEYAGATMKEIFDSAALSKAMKLSVDEPNSVCFIFRNGKFTKSVLPQQAQFSMVTNIIAGDFNNDNHPDLLLLGNHSDNRLKIGSLDANYGCLLAGDGKGGFSYVSQANAGLSVTGDVKSAEQISIDGHKIIAIAVADGVLQFYQMQ